MRLRRRRGAASLAQRILVLQVLLLVVVISAAVALALTDARADAVTQATDTAVAVAVTAADAPVLDTALAGTDPSALLQPYAERVRADSGTDFVVVMSVDGIRYSHPNPALIGGRFLGSIAGAQQGSVVTERYTGTLGPSVRAVVPVVRQGRVVALVAVGISVARVDASVVAGLPVLAAAGLSVLSLGVVGALLINRRVRRVTHGMAEAELGRMYEFYDAVLRSIREGLLLLDRDGRIALVNTEGARLLGLADGAVGRSLDEVGLPVSLVSSLRGDDRGVDELHLVGDRVLVFHHRTAETDRELGSVITFRDHTELQALSGELDTVRGMAESLRSQAHESSNRLHTVVSLIEMGRPEQAVEFAIRELELAQRLTDRVVDAIDHPVAAALLLGKTAQAAERGIDLRLTPGSYLRALPLPPEDVVTVVGNLIDNALDAVAEQPLGDGARLVSVGLAVDADRFEVTVADSGPGIRPEDRELVLQRGWSTKAGGDGLGRGLGLALVVRTVRRHGGRLSIGDRPGGGAAISVSVPAAAEVAR